MTKFPLPVRAAALLAALLCAASCERKATTAADATPQATPDRQGVTFGDGFHKEEASPAATLRWVRQDAALRVAAPAEGRYRLTFRPFTAFSTVENTIDVSVNGQPAGSFSTHAFDLSNPAPVTVETPLRAGDNDLRLHSRVKEIRLGETDDRMASYGLVLPVAVERVP